MHRNGISLIELSIALVVIGLIAGSVMVGASLIRNSEVKTVLTESQKYKTAMFDFRTKYASWPGDMIDATQYWGIRDGATGDDDTCSDAGTTSGTTTCNGNGDGFIANRSATYFDERFLAWQHLANAGLIAGSYTGFGGTIAAFSYDLGVNVPKGAISNSYYILVTLSPTSGNAQYFDRDRISSVVYYGGTPAAPLTPEEAWNVDMKLDDGIAGNGKIYPFKGTSTWGPGCAAGDATTSEYSITSKSKLCTLHFEVE